MEAQQTGKGTGISKRAAVVPTYTAGGRMMNRDDGGYPSGNRVLVFFLGGVGLGVLGAIIAWATEDSVTVGWLIGIVIMLLGPLNMWVIVPIARNHGRKQSLKISEIASGVVAVNVLALVTLAVAISLIAQSLSETGSILGAYVESCAKFKEC